MPRGENYRIPTSHEVWRWPEFRNLCKRLGFDLDESRGREERSLGLTIVVGPEPDSLVRLIHTFQGKDTNVADKAVEITHLGNEQFRSFQPSPKKEE